mgnify:CR=1 FL=1
MASACWQASRAKTVGDDGIELAREPFARCESISIAAGPCSRCSTVGGAPRMSKRAKACSIIASIAFSVMPG